MRQSRRLDSTLVERQRSLDKARREAEVARRTLDLTELAQGMQHARENERGRVSCELHDKLDEAMQKLSPSHRLVVTLHDVQGLPHDEIATIMECNVGTVRSRLFYARQQLQSLLTDYLK